MQVVVGILAAVAGVAWLMALLSVIAMLRHRAPGVSLAYLATRGIKFFDPDKFTAAAAPHRRRLGIAFIVFFAAVLAAIAVGAATLR